MVPHGVTLYRELSVEGRTRLVCASQLGSGDFLRAIPSNHLFRMDGSSFVTALSRRVGVDLLAMVDVHRCSCGAALQNSSGSHYITCRHRGWPVITHDRVRNCVIEMLRQVVPSSRIRVPDRNIADHSWQVYSPHKRPDITVLDWNGRGSHLVIDVAVVHPGASHHVDRASWVPLHTCACRERIKTAEYGQLPIPHRFLPFVVDTFGGLGDSAARFLKELSRLRRGALCGEVDHATWSARYFWPFWRQRLSVVLQHTIGLGIVTRSIEDCSRG